MIKSEYLEQLNNDNVISIVPSGNSMWPILKHKSQSVIVEKKKTRLKVFDVALYYRENGVTVLHRVIKVLENSYVIQGDSQSYVEEVPEERVFGKMIGYYNKEKFISVENKKYIKKVEKWYKNDKRRKRKCKFHFLKLSLIHKIKVVFKKIFFIQKGK